MTVVSLQEQSARVRMIGAAGYPVEVGDTVFGQAVIDMESHEETVTMVIYSTPKGADVYVNNRYRGRTGNDGLEVRRVKSGECQVRVTANGYHAFEQRVQIVSHAINAVRANLRPVVKRPVYRLGIASVEYITMQPTDNVFATHLDGSLRGIQVRYGQLYRNAGLEAVASWQTQNFRASTSSSLGGLDEVHRLAGSIGIKLFYPMARILPFIGGGYELGQLYFNNGTVLKGDEWFGRAGHVADSGWFITAGVILGRWLYIGGTQTITSDYTSWRGLSIGINFGN